MIIRRKNWPAFLVVAIFGPILGAFLALQYLPVSLCPADDGKEASEAPETSVQDSAEQAPLQLPDGDRIALDEIAPERSVAVVVMKGTWCPVCQRQLKRLSEQLEQIRETDATVVGLSTADPETNGKLADKLELRFPILSDASRELHERLEMWSDQNCHAIPGVVFIDESGEIADVHRGRYPGKPQDEFVLDRLESLTD